MYGAKRVGNESKELVVMVGRWLLDVVDTLQEEGFGT